MRRRLLTTAPLLLTAALLYAQDPVDDVALRNSIEAQGQTLVAENRHVAPGEILKGLQLTSTKATVPNPFNLVSSQEELYDKVKQATVVMSSYSLCGRCDKHHANSAGGFIISPDGLAVTNYHVMDKQDATAFAAFTHQGKMLRVTKILAADKTADVALVQLEGSNLPYLPIADKATIGARVWALSHPSGHFYTLTSGIASRYAMSRGVPWLEITADYAGGSSGCPIVNDRGQVVGLVSMTNTITTGEDRNVQMVRKICVPSSAIHKLIED